MRNNNYRTLPTVFHITHIKSGSQWVAQVLRECAPEREIPQEDWNAQTIYKPIQIGKIYPGVYLSRPRFEGQVLSHMTIGLNSHTINQLRMRPKPLVINWINFQLLKKRFIYFIVVRDLRDTLISLFFSLKFNHKVINPVIAEQRKILNESKVEDGLIFIIKNILWRVADNQESWAEEDTLRIRYEDLIQDEFAQFKKIVKHCELEVDLQKLERIVEANSFENRTGRNRGQEDNSSHYRKGIVGDWKNYFTPTIACVFKEHFGKTLIQTGYEKDLNW